MQLLPALVEADLASFGAALTEVQRVTGRLVRAPAGRRVRPGPSETLVRSMAEWGAAGVGQSSWGPAVYGLVASAVEGREMAARAAGLLGTRGRIFEGGFAASGARVWRREPAARMIDSSFCTMYTGPSKPPAVGDLPDVDGFGARD